MTEPAGSPVSPAPVAAAEARPRTIPVSDRAVTLAHLGEIEFHKARRHVTWKSTPGEVVRAMLEHAAPEIAVQAVKDAGFDQAELAADVIRLRVQLGVAVDEVCKRIARICERRGNAMPPGVVRNAWLEAAGVALEARGDQERSDEKESP